MLTPSPVQTTYTQYLTAAQNGMPATTSGWDIDTKICEDPAGTAGIGFGLAVSQGTLHGDRSACLGGLSGKAFVGVTVADPTLPNLSSTFTDKYQDTDNMGVMVRGDIWVVAHEAVNAGDAAYYNTTTGLLGNSNLTSGTAIDDARWMTTAVAGALAVLRLSSSSGNSDAG
jgi:hypothetical protein